jgi:GTP cyclohydrolase III
VEIEIQSDSGTGKTLEIRHVDLAKNTTTVLWSPGTLAGGQTVQLTINTSGWSTGNHAIQFFLDGELYTRVISKF